MRGRIGIQGDISSFIQSKDMGPLKRVVGIRENRRHDLDDASVNNKISDYGVID